MGGNHLLKGRVISVPDGDTLVLYLSAGGTERVRLYGVDSPELSQAGGEESSAFLRSLALYKKVDMDVRYKDPYGRSVAVVRLDDGRVLNEELLRHGQTWLYTRYCDAPQCTAWKKLEREAKQARLGLWQDAAPTPPWKWRGALRPKNSRNNQRTPERI